MTNEKKTSVYTDTIWIVLTCVVHFLLFRSKLYVSSQSWQQILTMIIVSGLTYLMHRLLHFVFIKFFCKSGMKIKDVDNLVELSAIDPVAKEECHKWQFVIIYLAPFVVLTLLVDVICMFCAEVNLIFCVVAISNCVMCFDDIVKALIVIKKE